MSITSAIVLYAVIWCLTFLMVLPIGQVHQHETGDVVPGTPASAPTEARIARKAIISTIVAAVVWLGIFLIIYNRLVTIDDIPFLTLPSDR